MNYDNEEEYGPGEGEVYQHQATRRLRTVVKVNCMCRTTATRFEICVLDIPLMFQYIIKICRLNSSKLVLDMYLLLAQ